MITTIVFLVCSVVLYSVVWNMGYRRGRDLEQRRFREHLRDEFRIAAGRDPEILRVDDSGFVVESAPQLALPAPGWTRWRPRPDDLPPRDLSELAPPRCGDAFDEVADPVDDPAVWRELEQRVASQERVAAIVPKGSPVNECPHCRTVGHTDPACPIRGRLD